MPRDLVIIGCGGFGREVADVVDAINGVSPTWNLLGFVDDDPSPENVVRVERRGQKVLGRMTDVASLYGAGYVAAVGSSTVRKKLVLVAEEAGLAPVVLLHPTAALGANLEIGLGSVVCAHATIGSDITIGHHVHLDRGVHVGHDTIIEDFATAHPAATISGACTVKSEVELGTNCTLLPGITIGEGAVVGAGACVVRNVGSSHVVKGVPAK